MNKENILKNVFPGSDTKYNDSRIFFSNFDMSGLHDFHEYSTKSELFKYFEYGRHKKLSDSIEYINKVQDRISKSSKGNYSMYWFIRLRKSNKVIGSIALINVDFEKGVGEVGKALSPALWGNGYMSEAMNIYLEYCKYNLCLNKIVSNTRSDNYPNIKLMKKIGFKVINELKSYYKDKDGTVHDAIRMSIDL